MGLRMFDKLQFVADRLVIQDDKLKFVEQRLRVCQFERDVNGQRFTIYF